MGQAWQCGGSVLLVPCSHVGNLFRIVGGNRSSIEHRDNVGALETSTDEYKQLNYSIVPGSCILFLHNTTIKI